jgi:hypothetical protein
MTRDEIATRLGGTRNDMVDVVEKIVQAAVEAEREACAKVCETGMKDKTGRTHVQAFDFAAAIRARGQKE